MPSAIAPDDTSTTSLPRARSAAISPAQRATAAWSRPAPVVGDEARADLDDEAPRACDERRSWRVGCAPSPLRRDRRRLHDDRRFVAPSPAATRRSAGCSSSHSWTAKVSSRGRRRDRRDRNTGSFQRSAFTNAATRSSRSSSGTRSSLFSTSQRGFVVQRRVVLASAPSTIARASVDRIGVRVERRHVDEVQQQPRALQVAQELVAEARALGGAFDQARECRRRRSCGARRRARRRGCGASVVNG